jgi:mono/diheme cytochrome c family protein
MPLTHFGLMQIKSNCGVSNTFNHARKVIGIMFPRWTFLFLALVLILIALLFVRMHVAAAQGKSEIVKERAEAGRFLAEAWCTECHSVQRETAGTGTFAPDFTAIAERRSARWLNSYLHRPHVRMPEFGFDRDETASLITYIVSLKRL